MPILHVIIVAYKRPLPLRIATDCFLVQTNPNWRMTIVHDGPAPDSIKDIISLYDDPRITFVDTESEVGNYGYANRRMTMMLLNGGPGDFVLHSNDDNYIHPRFVELLFKSITSDTGMVYYDIIHSHRDYDIHYSELKENSIDMAAFIVRLDIAQETGFNHDHYSADGAFAEDCLRTCEKKGLKAVKINKVLLVHN